MTKALFKLITGVVLILIAGCGGHSQKDTASYQEGVDAYAKGNYAVALEKFKPLAEGGNMQAQFNLGVMYRQGQGVPQDDKPSSGLVEQSGRTGARGSPRQSGLEICKRAGCCAGLGTSGQVVHHSGGIGE